jgi:hypothetical protein
MKKTTKYPEWVTTKSQQMMHDDFRSFLWYIWKHLGLPPPTDIQYDIASYIQTGPSKLIVEAFRGVGKSWITAAFVLWVLYRDPQEKILVVSASKERADAFSIFVKQLINLIDILQFLKPRDDQRDSNLAFDVGPATPDQSPSVKSVGITGQLTGSRASLIVPDDIEVPGNSATEDQREKLATLASEFIAILKPGGRIVALGTPQTEQSLYNVLGKRGYEQRIWPARYTTGKVEKDGREVDEYNGKLAPYITARLAANPALLGQVTDPLRFSEEDMLGREASYGRSGFSLQFMLNTSLSDANRYPLRTSDLIVMDLNKEIAPVQLTWASGHQQQLDDVPNVGLNGDRCHSPMYTSDAHVPYQGAVMYIDPHGRGADECAYAVTKQLNGLVFVTAWGGIKGDGFSPQTLEALALIAKDQKVNEVVPESNFGDGMFNALLAPVMKRVYPCTIVDDHKVVGQKEVRVINKLEPALTSHRVVMDKAVAIANAQIGSGSPTLMGLYQLTHITRERGALKHDDRIDVLAEAVGHWIERLDVDNEDAEQKHEDRLKADALEKYARAMGRPGPGRHKNYVGRIGQRPRPSPESDARRWRQAKERRGSF